MRVLVTGGAGFIGSHIVDALLQRGHIPFVVDNLSTGSRWNLPADVPFFEVDICDANRLSEVFDTVQPDWVCHQAAQMSVSRSMREPAVDAEVNVIGLLRVLENSARVNVQKLVFASSGGVLYGDVSVPAAENSPANPISPYGIAKWVGEKYLEFFSRERGIQGVALRYANVYGPRQNPHGEAGVVAIFSQRLLAGESPTINGDGRYIRDYVYVQDVARANVLALESPLSARNIAINIGTGRSTDVNQLAELMRDGVSDIWRSAGRSDPVPACLHGVPRSGDLRSNLVNAAFAKSVLNWQPEVPLEVGIPETIRWFAEIR
ncbi:MAG: NAD-dependent epimerase/dehydratase family protein [Planctomycetes bacterium]|nr:NAD-dependent epimerase/dehydratase family protein [Planctomycetota bacterium]